MLAWGKCLLRCVNFFPFEISSPNLLVTTENGGVASFKFILTWESEGGGGRGVGKGFVSPGGELLHQILCCCLDASSLDYMRKFRV